MSKGMPYIPPPVDEIGREYPKLATTTKDKQLAITAAERFAMHRTFLNETTRAKELSMNAVLVWLVLWDDTKQDTGLATSGQKYVADRARCSLKSVKRAISELKSKQLIEVVRQGCNRHEQLSVYRISDS